MVERRTQFAQAIVPMLEGKRERLDAGGPASSEDRERLEENLAWWSGETQ